MNHLLFTIYDEKAQVFIAPFFVPTIGLATRAFSDCVNSPDHQFAKHPQDYSLFQIASFDDGDASISTFDKKSLGNGVEYIDPNASNSLGDFNHGPPDSPIQPNKTG